jgi:hypothetical protein
VIRDSSYLNPSARNYLKIMPVIPLGGVLGTGSLSVKNRNSLARFA